MAFTKDNFIYQKKLFNTDINIFSYHHPTDTKATISASGYFDADEIRQRGVREGDIVKIVQQSSGSLLWSMNVYRFNSTNSSTTITVALAPNPYA